MDIMLGSTEIIVLVVVIGVLIFGAKKIPQLAKTFGKAKGEFEKGKIEGEKELKDFKEEIDNVAKEDVAKEDVAKEDVAKEDTDTRAKDKESNSD
jgi:sec-independent protein translocase protein TatA